MKDSIILVAGYTHHDVYLITLWRISCGLDGHGLALIKTVRGSIAWVHDTLKSESQAMA